MNPRQERLIRASVAKIEAATTASQSIPATRARRDAVEDLVLTLLDDVTAARERVSGAGLDRLNAYLREVALPDDRVALLGLNEAQLGIANDVWSSARATAGNTFVTKHLIVATARGAAEAEPQYARYRGSLERFARELAELDRRQIASFTIDNVWDKDPIKTLKRLDSKLQSRVQRSELRDVEKNKGLLNATDGFRHFKHLFLSDDRFPSGPALDIGHHR